MSKSEYLNHKASCSIRTLFYQPAKTRSLVDTDVGEEQQTCATTSNYNTRLGPISNRYARTLRIGLKDILSGYKCPGAQEMIDDPTYSSPRRSLPRFFDLCERVKM